MTTYTNPELRERLKNRIMASASGGKIGQWSARKAQMLSAQYKAANGGYKGRKTSTQKSLRKWTKEKWGTKSGKPSIQGAEATGERYLPQRAIDRLSDSQYAATTAKKRKAIASGDQFSKNTKRAAAASFKARVDSFLGDTP